MSDAAVREVAPPGETMCSPIPDGWREETLGKMLRLEYGRALPSSIRRSGQFAVFGSGGEIGRHREFIAPERSVIVGRKGSVGAIYWSEGPSWPIDTAYWTVVAPSMDPRFVFYLLKHANLQSLALTTGVPGLSRDQVYAMLVRAPSLAEQQAIAGTLDRCAHLASATAQRLAKLSTLMDGLKVRLLFERGEPGMPDWPLVALGEVADWSAGGTPTSGDPRYYGGSIPWVTISDLDETVVLDTETHLTAAGLRILRGRMVPTDSVLLAMYGASIGKTGLAGVPMASNQAVLAGVAHPGVILPRFLLYSLQVRHLEIAYLGRGGTQPNINSEIVKRLPIPKPPLDVQQRIVDTIDAGLASVAAEAEYERKLGLMKVGLETDLLGGSRRLPGFGRSSSSRISEGAA
jgi:type I restriction enzyme S subunit